MTHELWRIWITHEGIRATRSTTECLDSVKLLHPEILVIRSQIPHQLLEWMEIGLLEGKSFIRPVPPQQLVSAGYTHLTELTCGLHWLQMAGNAANSRKWLVVGLCD